MKLHDSGFTESINPRPWPLKIRPWFIWWKCKEISSLTGSWSLGCVWHLVRMDKRREANKLNVSHPGYWHCTITCSISLNLPLCCCNKMTQKITGQRFACHFWIKQMIVNVLRAGAGIARCSQRILFSVYRGENGSIQPHSSSVQKYEINILSGILFAKRSNYHPKNLLENHRRWRQTALPIIFLSERISFLVCWVSLGFLTRYLIIEKFPGSSVNLFCEYWSRSSKQKIPALTCFHNTSLECRTAHR